MQRMQIWGLSLFLLSCSGVSHAAISAKATICSDCSYQQALALVQEVAAPAIQCTYANEVPDAASEQCNSIESRYVVFDIKTDQAYGFRLFHSNQGGPFYSLELQASNEPVEADIQRLLRVAAQARGHLQQGIAEITASLVQQLSIYSVQTVSVFSAEAQSSDQCSQDPHARAIRDAVDSRNRLATLQNAADNSFINKKSETVSWFKNKDGLSMFSLDSVSFSLTSPSGSFGSASIEGTFKVVPGSDKQFITRTYYPNSALDSVTVGLTSTSASFSTVVDVIDYSSGIPRVSVSENGTFIEGVALRFITNTTLGTPLSVSACVHNELKKLLDIRPSTTSGGGSEGPPGSVNGGGSGGGDLSTCTYDVYSNGRWTGSYQSVC
jgi:hypothetical protein